MRRNGGIRGLTRHSKPLPGSCEGRGIYCRSELLSIITDSHSTGIYILYNFLITFFPISLVWNIWRFYMANANQYH
ncbi:hypothetical protein CSB85_4025 [Pseudomonas aeruginosa]|nr:hypothetical protein CSB97_3721 [Pseudomonas aeruginosa]AVK25220.1 hypothetical protein CSB85_4025 [Pseudomonas aeruginosa]AWE79797.1 hypothetical protein CSC31_6541 [Pseudomonas aeruginosa]AWZ92279.1 hypothetical protein CSC46_4860 [Pseudomonas aeruginosa]CCQ83883.1 hypothetical protein PA18A_456 [Pseudomonas aeruginosa 18A]